MMSNGPLAGVKVLDISIALTGPYAVALMADQGAEAIKVEKPEGIASALADAQRANKDGKTAVIEIITRQDTRFSWYNDLLKQGAQ